MKWSDKQQDGAGGEFIQYKGDGVEYFISLADEYEGTKNVLYVRSGDGDFNLGAFDTVKAAQEAAAEDYKANY